MVQGDARCCERGPSSETYNIDMHARLKSTFHSLLAVAHQRSLVSTQRKERWIMLLP